MNFFTHAFSLAGFCLRGCGALGWRSLVLGLGLLGTAGVWASEQQVNAAFAVAVTLHTVVKPLSADQLCRDGLPIQSLGATIQIECPHGPPAAPAAPAREANPAAPGAIQPRQAPEVTVTF